MKCLAIEMEDKRLIRPVGIESNETVSGLSDQLQHLRTLVAYRRHRAKTETKRAKGWIATCQTNGFAVVEMDA